MPDSFPLKNKVAVVTGALGLLGKQHCIALADAGAHVVVCDVDQKKCNEFAISLNPEAIGVRADVTNPGDIQRLRDAILGRFDSVDILVNNAAINDMFENPTAAALYSKFENYSMDMWKKSLDVNVTGVFLCSQIIGSEMARRGKGSIINVASTYGLVGPDQSLYANPKGEQVFYKSPSYPATKGAVIAFTRFLAAYWGHCNVRVNTLTPGGVENMQEEYFVREYSRRTPLGRMAQPDDYRGAVVFLASDASAYMTGANLVVDGGWTTW
ncbi:SDR family oxidoreductase [bacterium]|nr:SDR family oxidoreductase [bacterium]